MPRAHPHRWPLLEPVSAAGLNDRLEALVAELRPRLPDIDVGDMKLILASMLRPIGRSGRILFIKELRPGVFAF